MHYVTYLVTFLSITGTVANSFQKRWCFIVWGCTNTFWTIYNAAAEQYAQAILYAFNFIMAVIGFVKWKKNSEAEKCNRRTGSDT